MKCELCWQKEALYSYELFHDGIKFDELQICQECGEKLYNIVIKIPYPIKLLSQIILLDVIEEKNKILAMKIVD